MATLPAGTPVSLLPEYEGVLAFPPPVDASLYIAVHEGALRAGERNLLTQCVGFLDQRLVWAGALDERLLTTEEAARMPDARTMLSWCLGRGSMWNIIWPGELSRDRQVDLFTVYQASRPWVILGELEDGSPLAAPLNDATNPVWFTPVIEANDVLISNAKRCQLELAHLWSFPEVGVSAGQISRGARPAITEMLGQYFVAS